MPAFVNLSDKSKQSSHRTTYLDFGQESPPVCAGGEFEGEERKEVRTMLFMVTMTHTAESCPGNNPEKTPEEVKGHLNTT